MFTTITVNENEIGTYSFFDDEEMIDLIIKEINKSESSLTLMCSVEQDDEGELDDVIYFNGERTSGSITNLHVCFALFEKLKINYTYIEQDYDYNSWKTEKKLVLETKIKDRKFDGN